MGKLFAIAPFAALAISLLAAPPARADWQNTKWGMTESELKTVLGSEIVAVPRQTDESPAPGKSTPRYKSRYVAGDHRFAATFGFDASDKLADVTLLLEDRSRCFDLLDDLKRRYGAPFSKSRDGAMVLWQAPPSDEVMLMIIGINDPKSQMCFLRYKPLQTANTKGL